MEKLTIKVPYEERTLVHKNNDGFRIRIKGVDVLDYQKGLISKSYEEVLFFYFMITFRQLMILVFVR